MAKDKLRTHHCGQKTLKGIFFGYVPCAEGGLSGDLMTADYEDSHESEAVEIYVDSNTTKYSKKNITNVFVRKRNSKTSLSKTIIISGETLSKKMMLKSKKATKIVREWRISSTDVMKNFVGGFTT